MKPAQFYILILIASLCVLLSVVNFVKGNSLTSTTGSLSGETRQFQEAQGEMGQMQQVIQQGQATKEVGTRVLQRLAMLAKDDPAIRGVLEKHGYGDQLKAIFSGSNAAPAADAAAPDLSGSTTGTR